MPISIEVKIALLLSLSRKSSPYGKLREGVYSRTTMIAGNKYMVKTRSRVFHFFLLEKQQWVGPPSPDSH